MRLLARPMGTLVPAEPRRAVAALAFSPDGGRLVAGLRDGNVVVYRVPEQLQ